MNGKPPLPPASDLIGIDAAARLLRVSGYAVRRLVRDGQLPAWRIGRGPWKLSRAAVLAFPTFNGCAAAEQAEPRTAGPSLPPRFSNYNPGEVARAD